MGLALACVCLLIGLHLYLFRRQKKVQPSLRPDPLIAFGFDVVWCGLLLLPIHFQFVEMIAGFVLAYVVLKPLPLKIWQRNLNRFFLELWPQLILTFLIVLAGLLFLWIFGIEDRLLFFLLLWMGWLFYDGYIVFGWFPAQNKTYDPMTELKKPALEDAINQIAKKAGLESVCLNVKTQEGPRPHANARIDKNGKDMSVIFEKAMLDILDDPEIKAVIAHEFAHLYFNHLMRFQILKAGLFLMGVGVLHLGQFTAFQLMILAPVLSSLFLPILNGFKRRCEFQADQFAHQTAGGENLISALDKIHRFNKSVEKSDVLYQWFFGGHPDPILRKRRLKDEINGTGKMHLA